MGKGAASCGKEGPRSESNWEEALLFLQADFGAREPSFHWGSMRGNGLGEEGGDKSGKD